jgi:hypothetical protein
MEVCRMKRTALFLFAALYVSLSSLADAAPSLAATVAAAPALPSATCGEPLVVSSETGAAVPTDCAAAAVLQQRSRENDDRRNRLILQPRDERNVPR